MIPLLIFLGYFSSITSSNLSESAKIVSEKIYSNLNASVYQQKEPKDSANIYYMQGWNAYKKRKYGVARYYWELGSSCSSNVTSKYSCAFRLGLLQQTGQGVGKNLKLAFYYYNLAYADGQLTGNVDATKNIAAYYENGIYVPKDLDKALEWYEKAKVQGNKYCDADILRLKKMLSKD
ncbi:MAG: sel1 repeat family protein [Pedobacter sp.]|nr:sel1 repeat family protein [Chitinophagaceae bacterium]